VTLVVSLPDYAEPARRLALRLGLEYRSIERHRFPDGESKIRVPVDPPPHVILCQSLDRPNDKLVELLLACATLRENGARSLSLVAPYLCYMRQDTAFHPGEAVSQKIIGRFLAGQVNALITVDAHLHRIHDLGEAIPLPTAINLSAAPLLGEFLASRHNRPLLLGPDAESAQWVAQVAAVGDFEHAVATKQRLGDRRVRISLPDRDYDDRVVVLVDDVLASGHTLAEAAREVRAAGARKVCALVTHPLFVPGAEDVLEKAGVTDIWSSDSIVHPTNSVFLDGLLASALEPLR